MALRDRDGTIATFEDQPVSLRAIPCQLPAGSKLYLNFHTLSPAFPDQSSELLGTCPRVRTHKGSPSRRLTARNCVSRSPIGVDVRSRTTSPVVRSLSANRLEQHAVPVKIQELLLTAGEASHIDNLCGVDAHSLERRAMSDRRDDERSLILEDFLSGAQDFRPP
jgi:hypothetical protein